MRNLAEKRHNDWKKAIRKRNIIHNYGFDYYDNLHQYSKNKIHCSCPMCRGKTDYNRNRTTISDQRKLESMKEQEFDNE